MDFLDIIFCALVVVGALASCLQIPLETDIDANTWNRIRCGTLYIAGYAYVRANAFGEIYGICANTNKDGVDCTVRVVKELCVFTEASLIYGTAEFVVLRIPSAVDAFFNELTNSNQGQGGRSTKCVG